MIDAVVDVIKRYKYSFRDEEELQRGIEQALEANKETIPIFLREQWLGPGERIDFLSIPDFGIGIEVKVGGTAAAALRQLARYALHEEIRTLILVTGRMQAGVQPDTIHGKPIRVVCLMGGLR